MEAEEQIFYGALQEMEDLQGPYIAVYRTNINPRLQIKTEVPRNEISVLSIRSPTGVKGSVLSIYIRKLTSTYTSNVTGWGTISQLLWALACK